MMTNKPYLGMRSGDLEGKAYVKYWRPEMAPLAQPIRDAAHIGALPAELALDVEDAPRLLKDCTLPMENGYARLNTGQLFVAVHTPMPGVTGDMIDWWFAWHSNESARYRLWHPNAHRTARLKRPQEPAPDVADREIYVGNVSYVDEYIGAGRQSLAIQFKSPEAFGFEANAVEGSSTETLICAEVGPANAPVNFGRLVHQVRTTPEGAEMRSRFWLGRLVPRNLSAGNAAVRALNALVPTRAFLPLGVGHDMLIHCAQEMAHLASFLPDLYTDYH